MSLPSPIRLAVLADRQERRIDYLRISLTDRCNYRCTYCMPEAGVAVRPRAEILTFEEIERLVRVFASVGVRRLRLTGGEPTIRKDMVQLVARLTRVPGIDEVVMTTNGHLLGDLAAPLRGAGLAEVNVSIDTLDRERFRAITRRGDLDRVVAGIDAAIAVGLGVKLNAVALRGVNDGELADLCRFGWERGATPRFIEHMPMSEGALYTQGGLLTAAEIRASIAASLGADVVPADRGEPRPRGPARYFRVLPGKSSEGICRDDQPESLVGPPGGQDFGIISAMSEHFCATCNRVRMTATGDLHACLAYDDAVSLRDLVRGDADDDAIRAAITGAAAEKREGHVFQAVGAGAPRKHMVAIGG